MEAEMARPQIFCRLQFGRRVGRETAGVFVEFKLVNLVGPPVGYVGHEDKPVRRVGLDGMGAGCGHPPFDGGSDGSAVFDAVYRGRPLVVVGR